MIAIREPGTQRITGHYDPETGNVRDIQGRLLFRYIPALTAIEITRKGHSTTIPLQALVVMGNGAYEYK